MVMSYDKSVEYNMKTTDFPLAWYSQLEIISSRTAFFLYFDFVRFLYPATTTHNKTSTSQILKTVTHYARVYLSNGMIHIQM